jgi:GGDEF domain-containing protein
LPDGLISSAIGAGFAVRPVERAEMTEVLSFADQTLYEATRAGCNRVEFVQMPA